MVNLVTVPNVELMKTGSWDVSTGKFDVDPKLIQDAIAAHKAGVLRKPTIRLGHGDSRFSGDPAVGFVDNVRASEDGSTLYGDLVGVPKWLADIMPSAYADRSIEGLYDYTGPDGAEHPFVLTGLALLGATAPGVSSLKSLQDVANLYDADIAAAVGEIGGTPVELLTVFQPAAADQKEKGAVMASLKEQLAERFGLDPAAADEAIMAALNDKLPAAVETEAEAPVEPEVAPVVEPVPEPVAASAPSVQGVVQLDQAQYADLVAAATDGRAARAQQVTEGDERTVAAAIALGKVSPARKAHWMAALKADREGTTQVLASLATGLIPLDEIGHGVAAEAAGGVDVETADKNRVFKLITGMEA